MLIVLYFPMIILSAPCDDFNNSSIMSRGGSMSSLSSRCRSLKISRADSGFAPNQWETAFLCNDVSHWENQPRISPDIGAKYMLSSGSCFSNGLKWRDSIVGYQFSNPSHGRQGDSPFSGTGQERLSLWLEDKIIYPRHWISRIVSESQQF